MEKLPRPQDYTGQSADEANRRFGLEDWSENVDPYGTAARTTGGPRLRDVEAKTSGRTSRTPSLDSPAPAPRSPASGPDLDGSDNSPYGNQLGPIGQGGMNRVP